MDKYEYKVRAEQIKALIREGEYVQAAEIADTIDWRRIRNVAMLCTISDLYKINRRYEDARDMLLLAYDRHPGGRSICYSLCELSIKLEEFPQAVEYYKEFVQVAPRDNGRYILQYKLYEAQNVNLEERIAVLEEYKKREYREKWIYELAYLYHRVGLGTRCVEVCDELILWFGNGKYVIKAMELKMLHEPLTPAQQAKYDNRFQGVEEGQAVSHEGEVPQEVAGEESGEHQPEAQLQGEEAAEEVPGEEGVYGEGTAYEGAAYEEAAYEGVAYEEGIYGDAAYPESVDEEKNIAGETAEEGDGAAADQEAILGRSGQNVGEPAGEGAKEDEGESSLEKEQLDPAAPTQIYGETHVQEVEAALAKAEVQHQDAEDMDIQVKTVDVSEYNTINLQRELAEGLREVLGDEQKEAAETAGHEYAVEEAFPEETAEAVDESDGYDQGDAGEEYWPEEEASGETENWLEEEASGETEYWFEEETSGETENWPAEEASGETEYWSEEEASEGTESWPAEEASEETEDWPAEGEEGAEEWSEEAGEYAGEDVEQSEEAQEEPLPEELAEVLSMSSDGQIHLVVPGDEQTGAQIEGQITIDDVLNGVAGEEDSISEEDGVEELEDIEDSDAIMDGTEDVFEAVDEEQSEYLDEEPLDDTEEEQLADAGEEPLDDVEGEQEPEEVLSGEAEEKTGEDQTEESQAKPEGIPGESTDEEPESATDKEDIPEDTKPEKCVKPAPLERDKAAVRDLTHEERELFAQFLQNRSDRERLVKALDSISMAAYTGNVIITGDEGLDTFSFAKNIVLYVQLSDTNFSGKTAKISGAALNEESAEKILGQLENGALIIQKASGMNEKTCNDLYKILQKESLGIIIILEDTKRAMNRFLAKNKPLAECFNARVDMEALNDETLVAFGKKYAKELEYSIDEMGVLALHTRIHDMQSSDHAVTVMEVKEIVDEAIKRANRKNLKHFCDVLFAKRYDEEDMIILREKDFLS